MHEAKAHLSKLVERAAKGEEIILAKAGKPMARLVAVGEQPRLPERRFGSGKSQIWICPDFDAPIPALEQAFIVSKIFPDESSA